MGNRAPSADLSVSKSVDNAHPEQGSTVHYTVTISALGPGDLDGSHSDGHIAFGSHLRLGNHVQGLLCERGGKLDGR